MKSHTTLSLKKALLKKFTAALATAGVATTLLSTTASAGTFTFSGQAKYVDRLWNSNGWTGFTVGKPIRYARVYVRKSSNNSILGSGTTDAAGNFTVIGSSGGSSVTVYAEILSQTAEDDDALVATPEIEVRNKKTGGALYALRTLDYTVSTSGGSVNLGGALIQYPVTTANGESGNPFNILDIAVDATLFWIGNFQADPLTPKEIKISWGNNSTIDSYTKKPSVILSGDDGYDDAVIARQVFHTIIYLWSETDNPTPGGPHYLNDGNQDARLALDEGLATALATTFTREVLGVPYYLDMDGAPTFGNTKVLFVPETIQAGNTLGLIGPAEFAGEGDEAAIAGAIYDLLDGDGVSSDDDAVIAGATSINGMPLPSAFRLVLESFKQKGLYSSHTHTPRFAYQWDALLGAGAANSEFPLLLDVFTPVKINLFEDIDEPNNSQAEATPVAAACSWSTLRTLYAIPAVAEYSPGMGDEDHYLLNVTTVPSSYVFETYDAHTEQQQCAVPYSCQNKVNSMLDPYIEVRDAANKLIKSDSNGAPFGLLHALVQVTFTKTGAYRFIVKNQKNTEKLRGSGSYIYRLCPGS